MSSSKSSVAIIGSGISGLSSAFLLNRSGKYDVTLLESEDTFGGHTLTDTTSSPPVDLGFQVYNLTTYPHLTGLLEVLGIDTVQSDMSFSLSVDGGNMEWASRGLDALFAQRKNLLSPSFWWMLREIFRFGGEAEEVLKDDQPAAKFKSMTLGQYLTHKSYSHDFIYKYLLPMAACVWSTPNAKMLEFPVYTFVSFWKNHHLLNALGTRPIWRVIKDRSQAYVKKIISELRDARTNACVEKVIRNSDQTVSVFINGKEEVFDHVVFATHSDTALKILGGDATSQEKDILGVIHYAENDVYLHSDLDLMPRNKKAWASWNCLDRSLDNKYGPSNNAVCVTYWANLLQNFPESMGNRFVTLNPPQPPRKNLTIRHLKLSHPVFDFAAIEAQKKLEKIQGEKNTWFTGAWCGYGFHEDGIKSAVNVTSKLGATVPWTPRSLSPAIPLYHQLCIYFFSKYIQSNVKKGSLRLILPDGTERQLGDPTSKGRHVRLRVLDTTMFCRIVAHDDIGLGEAYFLEEFLLDDENGISEFMALLSENADDLSSSMNDMGIIHWIGTKLQRVRHLARSNTLSGSRKNIEEHYDLGNKMYELFLDKTMTYSCGIFGPNMTGSMEEASLRKYDSLIEKCGITKDDLVAEIGCGWGGFAIRAVQKTGCRIIGITLSKEQYEYAMKKVKEAGLEDKISLRLVDYRLFDMDGQFDKLISCEMIEAVGHEHLDSYFEKCAKLLKPGGKMAIQVITTRDSNYESYCNGTDYIRRHIFPGGHLPCVKVIKEKAANNGLGEMETYDFHLHYGETLRRWRKNFMERKKDILALGYSEQFYRKFLFYFAYCESGFDYHYVGLYQVSWTKDPNFRPLGIGAWKSIPQRIVTSCIFVLFFLFNLLEAIFPSTFKQVSKYLESRKGASSVRN